MPTLTVLHKATANGQEANWIPTIPGNDGLSVQNNDGDYVASGNNGLGNPKNPFDWWVDVAAASATPLWIDDGTLSTPGIVINSVTVHIIHGNFDATNDLDVWMGLSGGGGPIGITYGYDEGDLGGYTLLPHTTGGPYVAQSHLFLTNPVTGVAWTANDLFLAGPDGGIQSFYFDKFRDGASYPNYSNYRINQIYLTVDYSSLPTSVSITGSGGAQAGGAAGTGFGLLGAGGAVVSRGPVGVISAGAGVPPELHANQWGLLHFVMKARLEERI